MFARKGVFSSTSAPIPKFAGTRGAAAAAFAGIVGTGIALAAAQNRRAYYDDY